MDELSNAVWSDVVFAVSMIYLALIMTIGLMVLDTTYSVLDNIGDDYVSSFYSKIRSTLVTTFITVLTILGAGIPATLYVALETLTRQYPWD